MVTCGIFLINELCSHAYFVILVVDILCCQVADSLEKGTEHEDEYMISEKELLVNRFDDLLLIR
jgi:hypothetical protein